MVLATKEVPKRDASGFGLPDGARPGPSGVNGAGESLHEALSPARGDVAGVLALFSDDIEWYEAEGMPYGGVYRGPKAIAEQVFARIVEDATASPPRPRSSSHPGIRSR